MAKHTKGPWRKCSPASKRNNGQRIIIVGANDRAIGDVWTLDEEGQANARLIAAAPDLLAALQDMVALVQEKGMPARWAKTLNKSRAALSKATPA